MPKRDEDSEGATQDKPKIKKVRIAEGDDTDTGPSSSKAADRAEEEEEDLGDEAELDELQLKRREAEDAEKRERNKEILERLTPEQMNRYECFRRSALSRPNVKRIMQGMVNTTVTQPMAIVMAGIAKLYVGDLVEGAKAVMSERGDSGALRPVHIRESFRRLQAAGKVPTRYTPALFRG